MAKEKDALLVVAGDVMDLLCEGNIAAFHKIADGHDMMFTPADMKRSTSAAAPWRRKRRIQSRRAPG